MRRLSAGKPRGTLGPVYGIGSLAVVMVLVGCGADRNPDGVSLGEITRRQCASVSTDLAVAAGEYGASTETTFLRYGRSPAERALVAVQLSGRLLPCLGARRGDAAARDQLARGIAVQSQRFGESATTAEAARALGELAALGKQIDALPLRD